MAAITNPFPAVLIGGPPHSGKSVLVYSLTRALRERDVAHYVLRACPDGEGDWSNEGDRLLVRAIRRKGAFTPDFTARVAGYLRRRHLPLLVDVGGRPTDDQLDMFALCSHAVLLVGRRADDPAAYDRDRAQWRDYLARAGRPLLADLQSDLGGPDRLDATDPVIRGVIAGLERGRTVHGPAFDALVARLAALCGPWDAVEQGHLLTAPASARLLHLPRLAEQLGGRDGRWSPGMLPALFARVPAGEAVALYGRAPNWVYTAAAVHALPAMAWLFDVRYGWLRSPLLPVGGNAAAQAGWDAAVVEADLGGERAVRLELITTSQYLDPDEPEGLPLPRPPEGVGLVLSGKVPHWLLLSAARQLGAGRPWLAVYQPPLGGAVVVWSAVPGRAPGDLIPNQT